VSRVVVDASIVVKWVVEEENSEDARTLLTGWLTADTQPVAPSWLTCEVANILHWKVLRRELTLEDAEEAYEDAVRFVTVLPENPADGKRALRIAYETGQKQAYDAQYLAFAEHLGVEYWTDDGRFVAAVAGTYPQVKRLGHSS
jgi:predicted nucleic acid-binding protein